jgi:nitrous oxide reductase accessory protein NosL
MSFVGGGNWRNQRKSKLPTCHKSLMNINTWSLLVEEIEEPKGNQNYRPATSHWWTLIHDLCWWRKLKNQRKSKLPTCHKSPININTWALLVEEIEEPKGNQNYRPATSHRWTLIHDLCWWRKLKNQRKSKLPTCHKSPMNINTWALLVEEIEEPSKIKTTDLPQVIDEH